MLFSLHLNNNLVRGLKMRARVLPFASFLDFFENVLPESNSNLTLASHNQENGQKYYLTTTKVTQKERK